MDAVLVLCSRMPGRPVQRGCSSGVCERMQVHPVCQRGRSPCVCSCIPVHHFVKCGCDQLFKKKKKKFNCMCGDAVLVHASACQCIWCWRMRLWCSSASNGTDVVLGCNRIPVRPVCSYVKKKKSEKVKFQKILSVRHLFQSARCMRTHAGACSCTPRIVYGCGRACAESRNIRFLPFRDRRGRLSVRRPGAL